MSNITIHPGVFAAGKPASPQLPPTSASYTLSLLKDINSDNASVMDSFPGYYTRLTEDIGVFFATTDYSEAFGLQSELGLYVTNTSEAGTVKIASYVSGSPIDEIYSIGNGKALFKLSQDYSITQELHVTDGSELGTFILDSNSTSNTRLTPFVINGKGIFIKYAAGMTDVYVYSTDGTALGTQEIAGPFGDSLSFWGSDANNCVALSSSVSLFTTKTWLNAGQLWVSDGTLSGTNSIVTFASSMQIAQLTAIGANKAVFFLTDGSTHELWFTDGTYTGTYSIASGFEGNITQFVALENDKAVFQAKLVGGFENESIYITDGTASGTVVVYNNANYQYSNTGFFAKHSSTVALVACSSTSQPVKIAAVDTNTNTVSFIEPTLSMDSWYESPGANNGTQTFFIELNTSTLLYSLWVTDSTQTNTTLIATSLPYRPEYFASLGNGSMCFILNDQTNSVGIQIWVTDGTVAGTYLHTNLPDEPLAYNNPFKVSSMNSVFLALFDSVAGNEPHILRRL